MPFASTPSCRRACPAHCESNSHARPTTLLREAPGENRSLLTTGATRTSGGACPGDGPLQRRAAGLLADGQPLPLCAAHRLPPAPQRPAVAWRPEGCPVTAATHRPAQKSAGTVRQAAAGRRGQVLPFAFTHGRRGQVLPFAFTHEISAHVPPTANRIPRCDQTRQSDKPTLIRVSVPQTPPLRR